MASEQFKIRIGIDINKTIALKEIQMVMKALQLQANKTKIRIFDDADAIAYRKELAKVSASLTQVRSSLKKTGTASKSAFQATSKHAKTATKDTNVLGGSLVSAVGKFALWATIAKVLFTGVLAIKSMITNVIKLETEMTNFKIVSGVTDSQLVTVNNTVNNLVSSLGALKTEVLSASTEFARAGYTMRDSMILAEQAIIGARVGFTSLDNVSTILISSLKAFNLTALDSKDVVNDLFVTSKEAAVTFDGLGQAVRRSGNSLRNAGASYQQSLGLIASANESIQDPATVGSALKTITARLRGIDKDSNLPKLSKQLSDFNVEIENGAGGFRNVYDILNDLQGAFADSNDEFAKQAVLESLAGKRRANVLAGLLNNFSVAEDILKKTTGDVNSALDAQNELLKTSAGQIELMKGNWQIFSQAIVDSGEIKEILISINNMFKSINDEMAKAKSVESISIKLNMDDSYLGKDNWLKEYVEYINGDEFKKANDKLQELITTGSTSDKQQLLDDLKSEKELYDINLQKIEDTKTKNLELIAIYKDEHYSVKERNQAFEDAITNLTIQRGITKQVSAQMRDLGAKGLDIANLDGTIESLNETLEETNVGVVKESLSVYEEYLIDMENTSSDTFQSMVDDWDYLTDEMKKNIKEQLKLTIETSKGIVLANQSVIESYGLINDAISNNQFIPENVTNKYLLYKNTTEESTKLMQDNETLGIEIKKNQELLDNLGKISSSLTTGSTGSTKGEFIGETILEEKLRNIEFKISEKKEALNQLDDDASRDSINLLKKDIEARIVILDSMALIEKEIADNTNKSIEAREKASKSYQSLSLDILSARTEIYKYNEDLQQSIDDEKKALSDANFENYKNLTSNYFDKLKQGYDDDLAEFKKNQQDKIDVIDASLDKLRDKYDEEKFVDEEDEILNAINKLEKEKIKLRLATETNDLQAKKRVSDIETELIEENERLSDLRRDRDYDLEEDALNDKKDRIEEETEEREDAYDDQIKALEKYQDEVEDKMDKFEDNWEGFASTLGDDLENGILPNIENISQELSGLMNKYEDIKQLSFEDAKEIYGGSSSSGGIEGTKGTDSLTQDEWDIIMKPYTGKSASHSSHSSKSDISIPSTGKSRSQISDEYNDKHGHRPDIGVIDAIKKTGGTFHDGGVIGGGSFKNIDIADYFSELGANEVPIIANNGETVITENQRSQISDNMNNKYNNLLNIQNLNIKASDSYQIEKVGEDLAKGAKKEMLKKGV